MVNTRTIQRSFAGGELSPEMFGRIDSATYQNGLGTARNFIIRPQGPAAKRPGFLFVAKTKGQGLRDAARLIPFAYSTEQTLVVEMGSVISYEGIAGAVTNLSLTNATPGAWTNNQWAGYTVLCDGCVAQIASSTTDVLFIGLSPSGTYWSPRQPTPGASFSIEKGYMRFHTQGQSLMTGTSVRFWNTLTNVPVTVPSNGDTFACTAHNFANGDKVFLAGGTISGGSVVVGTNYYVVNATANNFKLATAPGGSALTTGTPSGSFTVTHPFAVGELVRSGLYAWYCMFDHTTAISPAVNSTTWHQMGLWDTTYGSLFEMPSPYATKDLLDVHFAQSEDIVTLTHRHYPPRELRRYGATNWVASTITWSAGADAPTISGIANAGRRQQVASIQSNQIQVTANATGGSALIAGDTVYIRNTGVVSLDNQWFLVRGVNGTNSEFITLNYLLTGVQWTQANASGLTGTIERLDYLAEFVNTYVVTTVDANGIESSPSNEVTLNNGLYANGNTNSIGWIAKPGAQLYRVYRKFCGIFTLIGSTKTTSFVDDNITPDAGETPPIYGTPVPMSAIDDYPSTVGFFEQRRMFAGSVNEPQTLYATQSGTDNDLSYHLPSQADDRLKFKIRARELNVIKHIVPLNELLLLTSSAEWRVTSINSDALTPESISVRPQSYVGASNVQPEIVNNSLVFAAARGGHVRELGYNWQSQGFVTSDLSLRAAHLFDHQVIKDICMSRAPHPIVWFVSSDGRLLGLTYVPEEQIAAWHQHDTFEGSFTSCCTVSEGDEDILYVTTERMVNGALLRCVECMAEQEQPEDLAGSYFLDCGTTYSGPPVSFLTGLMWLEGATVQVLADGKVHRDCVVSNFSITLDYPASTVRIGLGYAAEMRTLPVAFQAEGLGQGRTKNVNKAYVRMVRSTGVMIGPDAGHTTKSNVHDGEPGTVRTDEVEIVLNPVWSRDGRIYLAQTDPLPFVVTNITLEIAVGS